MLSGLTNYLPESALTVFDNLEFFIRIVLAAALGALVGLERSKRQKEAGVRTHCIIGAGLYWVGFIEAAVLVAIQIVLHRFPVGADALTTQELLVEMADEETLLSRFDDLIKAHGGQITESSLSRENGILRMEVTARLEPPITHEEALAFMNANPGVTRISV